MTDSPAELTPAERELDALPVCGWVKARTPTGEALTALVNDADRWRDFELARREHLRECSICQHREAVLDRMEREAGGGGWFRAFESADRWVRIQPAWARPMWKGAGFFVFLTVLRGGAILLFQPSLHTLAMFGQALLVAAGIGGGVGLVGGNAYRWLHPRAPTWGPLGPVIAGIMMMGTLIGLAGGVMYFLPDTAATLHTRWMWTVMGIFTLVLGSIAGWAWFRPGKQFKLW